MSTLKPIICPSLLSADLSSLSSESIRMMDSGADWLQCVAQTPCLEAPGRILHTHTGLTLIPTPAALPPSAWM